jgi:hypothetical protein
MHFGLYLKKKGLISAEQLVNALEAQLASMPRIGQLALEEGIVSPREIFEVLLAQSNSPSEMFGEIAIQMGFMTRNELMQLLMIQADRKQSLETILVAQGVLSDQEAAAHILEFRRSNAKGKTAPGHVPRIVPALRGRKSVPLAADIIAAV